MVDACVPPEGAENLSQHWLCNTKGHWRVFDWNANGKHWGAVNAFRPDFVHECGWRYIGPATPTADTDLAEAQARIAELERAFIAKLRDENQCSVCPNPDICACKGEMEVWVDETRAALDRTHAAGEVGT
jgi:hypothetical protein